MTTFTLTPILILAAVLIALISGRIRSRWLWAVAGAVMFAATRFY